ncbi:MAG: ferrous iron transport protein A [Planctomycetales bacterium]|nr:ferrous iron transport protein A [Planctomycetales bacterium]
MGKLSEFQVGQRGQVVDVLGNDHLSRRLLEMGITRGVEIALIGTAPLGDPLELEVRGYRLSVRRGEAERVEMQ